MKKIRLELESFKILKKRERWQIYFIVYTVHPENPDQSVLTFVPGNYNIDLKPNSDNFYSFRPEGEGTDALRILHIPMPAEKYIDVRICMMQSRDKLRTIAAKINEVKKDLDVTELKLIKLGNIQWYAIDKGIDIIAEIFEEIKDRKLGFVSMDEEFEEEFEKNPNQRRTKKLSSGQAEVTWVWELKYE